MQGIFFHMVNPRNISSLNIPLYDFICLSYDFSKDSKDKQELLKMAFKNISSVKVNSEFNPNGGNFWPLL